MKSVRWSFVVGFVGGMDATGLSIFQLILRIRTIFWWSGSTYIAGNALIISGIVGLAAGLFGLYGAAVGKKLGDALMLAAGLLISLVASFNVMFFGPVLFLGGVIALIEKQSV